MAADTPSSIDGAFEIDSIFENDSDVNFDRLAEPELKDIAQLRGAKSRYEAAFPETRNGVNGGRGARKNESGALSFSKMLSRATGNSVRTAERQIRIADGISAETQALIYSSERLVDLIARRRNECLALTHYDGRTQAALLERIDAGAAKTVAEAADAMGLIDRLPRWQREAQAAKRAIKRMEQRAVDETVRWMRDSGLLERSLKALGDEGWLAMQAEAEDLDLWKSASELAAGKLAGLPGSKKGVQILAERAGWRSRQSTRRGGRVTLYHAGDLPLEARRDLQRKTRISESRLGLRVLEETWRDRVTRVEPNAPAPTVPEDAEDGHG